MYKRSISALCVIFIASISFLVMPLNASAQINWMSSYSQGMERANYEKKPLYLYFYTPSARLCQKFDNDTYSNNNVAQLLNKNFICVRLNANQNRNMVHRMGLYRVPTVMVIDNTGTEFLRLVTYYPPQKLITSLSEALENVGSYQVENIPRGPAEDYSQAIFYESFDSLHGWGNEGSSVGCTVQISLLQGIRGNAFKIDYEILTSQHSYVQLHRTLSPREQIQFPTDFTVIFYLAGKGAENNLDLKFADADGTNYGHVMPIPTDFKQRRVVLTSNDIKYLWGGENKTLDTFTYFLLAVSPKAALNQDSPDAGTGSVYIDELVILPGIHK